MLQSYAMYACIQYTVIHNTQMNLSTVKWAQWDKTQSRELLGLFICVCTALCTVVAHSIAQNRPDNFPSYRPDTRHCSDDVYLREGGKLVPPQFSSSTWFTRELLGISGVGFLKSICHPTNSVKVPRGKQVTIPTMHHHHPLDFG